jgi:hypothetical protein
MYFWYGRAFQEKNHTGIDVSFNKIWEVYLAF